MDSPKHRGYPSHEVLYATPRQAESHEPELDGLLDVARFTGFMTLLESSARLADVLVKPSGIAQRCLSQDNLSSQAKGTAMPMMPGPLAAATYATIKVAGYAGFAYALNRMLDRNVHVWKFGFAKTGIGLVGGLPYFFAMMLMAGGRSFSDAQVYAGALPIRLAAWSVALALFYGFRNRNGIVILALVAGVLWSYLLDGAMALLYHAPGMAMAVC